MEKRNSSYIYEMPNFSFHHPILLWGVHTRRFMNYPLFIEQERQCLVGKISGII